MTKSELSYEDEAIGCRTGPFPMDWARETEVLDGNVRQRPTDRSKRRDRMAAGEVGRAASRFLAVAGRPYSQAARRRVKSVVVSRKKVHIVLHVSFVYSLFYSPRRLLSL